jgi:hypothetical protein
MRYIITESQLKHILKEAREYTDNEIIDFNEVDLQHEFNKLNDLLFNGELEPIEMLWNRTRGAHGMVKAFKRRSTGQITITSLSISKFLAITYKHFKDVLAHEMIHIYWLQKNVNAGHDYRFINQMNRINSMNLGFNVTLKGDGSQFELSKETTKKIKPLVVLITKIGNDYRLSLMSLNLYMNSGYRVSKIYDYLTNNTSDKRAKYDEVIGDFYLSGNPELLRYSVQKKLNNISYVDVSAEEVNKLVGDEKWMAGFVSRSGESTWDGSELPNNL